MKFLRLIIILFFVFAGILGLKEHFIEGVKGALGGAVVCFGIAGILWLISFIAKKSKKRDATSNIHAGAMAAHIIGSDMEDFSDSGD
ncbi:MAG: hypothetical protein C0602_04080 [Denitrovibrio sp.]|nr:MAG: hypothetical protein C0602_04080 [Denitrovibrio sp.]